MEHVISMSAVLLIGFIVLVGGMFLKQSYWKAPIQRLKDEIYWGGAYLLAFSAELALRIAF